MRIFFLFLFFILFFSARIYGRGDESLDCKLISKDLLKNADAVVRRSNTSVRIVSLNEVYETEYYAITILNKEGYEYSKLFEEYDKFTSIRDISGTLYDKDGKEIRRLKKININDFAPVSFPNIFDDFRVKFTDFNYSSYPFTVAYTIEKRTSISFFLPGWHPQKGYNCAVEKSEFQIKYFADLPLRYRSFHLDKQITELKDGSIKSINLSIENITAVKKDEFAPLENFPLPALIFATDTFEFGGFSGRMDTWRSFGKFFYDLNDNRQELPAEIKRVVHKLVDTCNSWYGKISLLYKYMQSNTRYVSIQLGIGGWQCFPASFVAEKGYGDCKALSNYMKALLKEVGIPSNAVLVYGGREKGRILQADFPYNAFNHVILCVPSEKDTVWLECTSKDLPAGYLSAFTHDRYVLMLTPDGGKVVKTPTYSYIVNKASRTASWHIDANDKIEAKITKELKGWFCDNEWQIVVDQPREKVENYLNGKFSLRTYKVDDFKISNTVNDRQPVIAEQITLTGNGKITRAGKRLFVYPDILPLNVYTPESIDKRERPFYLSQSYEMNDTEVIKLEGAYSLEYMPEETTMDFPFGYYHTKVAFTAGNTIKILRSYIQREGTYPPESFPTYLDFSKTINSFTEQAKLVLIKKE